MNDRRVILYVGDEQRGIRLETEYAPSDWFVLPATDTRQALGLYVTYWPDTVIIDAVADADTAEDVFALLNSLERPPNVALIGECEALQAWKHPPESHVPILARNIRDVDLVTAIDDLFDDSMDRLAPAI